MKQVEKERVCNFEIEALWPNLPLFGPDKLVVRYINELDKLKEKEIVKNIN